MNLISESNIRNRKVLAVTYPTITSWTWHANLFAMIERLPEAQDWIFSNYIQLQCRPDTRKKGGLFFEFFPFYNPISECPILHTPYIDRKFISDIWKDVKDFLIYCIENDYYIYGICNERYALHLEQDFFHELFIYGYDFGEQSFYCADFTFSNSGKYSFVKVPFDLVCRGFLDVSEKADYLFRGEGGIMLAKAKPQKEYGYKLDLDYLKCNLQEYINGVNSCSHYGLFYNNKTMTHGMDGEPFSYLGFGIKVYDTLIKYLIEIVDAQLIDIRPFHNLYEHKKLMTKRIEYLVEKGLIGQDKNREVYLEVEKESLILCNRIIKYKIRARREGMEDIIHSINRIRDKEVTELDNLVMELDYVNEDRLL